MVQSDFKWNFSQKVVIFFIHKNLRSFLENTLTRHTSVSCFIYRHLLRSRLSCPLLSSTPQILALYPLPSDLPQIHGSPVQFGPIWIHRPAELNVDSALRWKWRRWDMGWKNRDRNRIRIVDQRDVRAKRYR